MAAAEDDEDTAAEVQADIEGLERQLEKLEFRRMFSGEMDANNAFLDIQSGSGGTEAQDWAEMMLRMYLRWGEAKGFKTELIEVSGGDVAGIKSATIRFEGEYAIAWCASHRLIPETGAIPLFPRYLYRRKLMTISRLRSTRQTCAWTPTVRPVPADSTSTRPILLCG